MSDLSAREKGIVIDHLQKANDELKLALDILCGQFVKPYGRMVKAYRVISDGLDFLLKLWNME